MEKPNKEVYSIRIMFPVESDEQAIEYKKKVASLLSEIPDVTLQFSLMTPPANMPTG